MPAALALEDQHIAQRRSALRDRDTKARPLQRREIELRRIALGPAFTVRAVFVRTESWGGFPNRSSADSTLRLAEGGQS